MRKIDKIIQVTEIFYHGYRILSEKIIIFATDA